MTAAECLEGAERAERAAAKARADGNWAVAAAMQGYAHDLRRGLTIVAPPLPKYEPEKNGN